MVVNDEREKGREITPTGLKSLVNCADHPDGIRGRNDPGGPGIVMSVVSGLEGALSMVSMRGRLLVVVLYALQLFISEAEAMFDDLGHFSVPSIQVCLLLVSVLDHSLWGDREQLITSNNPTWCNPEWEALMGSCWSADPTERPFVLILCFLEGLFCAL
ncbi:hypothetical protein Tco_1540291 [Tanacetum coccineum]